MRLFVGLSFLFFLCFSSLGLATELRMSHEDAIRSGFLPATSLPDADPAQPRSNIEAHSLDWPVVFLDAKHTIGNSMPEYQNYGGESYYHGGSDLRLAPEGRVLSPVDGQLQGGYYTYVTDPNTGEEKKYTKPITSGGDPLYFELTIKNSEGYLFEFHHVNPAKLPANIYRMVVAGGGPVAKGDWIGQAAIWPVARFGERYHHIHYNMFSPQGLYLNAEYFSRALEDTLAPSIKNIFAVYKSSIVEVKSDVLMGRPQELIVSALDLKGQNIYPLPPVVVQASWLQSSGLRTVGWDFTQSMRPPDIREVYARDLRLDDGRRFTTRGDYDATIFLFRLKLPNESSDSITLKIQDSAGNEIQKTLFVR